MNSLGYDFAYTWIDVYGNMFSIKMMSISIICNKIQLTYDYVKFIFE